MHCSGLQNSAAGGFLWPAFACVVVSVRQREGRILRDALATQTRMWPDVTWDVLTHWSALDYLAQPWALGVRRNTPLTQSQIAATIAAALGYDWPRAEPRAAKALPAFGAR